MPLTSVTVHTTVVAPTAYGEEPSFVVDETAQLSDVVAEPSERAAEQRPASEFTEMSEGAVIVGFWLSITVTDWFAVAVRPEPSVTVQTTDVTPTAYGAEPLFDTDDTEQLSDVVAEPRAGDAEQAP